MLNNIKTKANEHGFTIIELLIVIVIIAILAAITLVAYANITARGKTAAEQGAASQVQQKIEAYNTDGPTNAYPTGPFALTGATSSSSYYLASGAATFSTAAPAAPTTNTNTLWYYGTAPGGCLYYWSFSTGGTVLQASVGSPATACPASATTTSIGTSPNNMGLLSL